MKHIKSFKLFEGIIKPYDFDKPLDELKSLTEITREDLERILDPLDVEFVDLDYFKSKVQTQKELELIPEDPMLGGLRFAAFNYYTNKMYMCVYKWDMLLRDLNDKNGRERFFALIREILRHESIHKQQDEKRRKNIQIRTLEFSPVVPEKYFASSDEIMAYAQSFIDQCKQRGMSYDQILDQIKSKNKPVSWIENIYNNLPVKDLKIKKTGRTNPNRESRIEREKALSKFKKYVYMYIKGDEEKSYRLDEL